jgi:hypothetical protein
MRCGAGDLDVGKGAIARLDGVQRFAHVCVHDGGVLTTANHLTLMATTIAVDAGSQIRADGVITTPPPGLSAGHDSDHSRAKVTVSLPRSTSHVPRPAAIQAFACPRPSFPHQAL